MDMTATSLDRYLNKVTCGDCLELMRELPDESVDLVVTDPPYGVGYKKKGDVIKCQIVRGRERVHPTQKPLELLTTLLKATEDTKQIVLDPFLGSGTTAVAAERLGRQWIGFEISPEYCAIAEARIVKERAQLKIGGL